jgi:hypothetical protein
MKNIKKAVDILIIVAVISFIIGVVLKVTGFGGILWCNLFPNSFLRFSNTCLLIAIALGVRQIWMEKVPEEKTG